MKQLIYSALLIVMTAGCQSSSPFETPTITVSSPQAESGRLVATMMPGGEATTRTVTVMNHGTCAVQALSSVEEAWLTMTPTESEVPPTGEASFTLTISSRDEVAPLPLGTFVGTALISATCAATGKAVSGSPAAIMVLLTVTDGDAGVDAGSSADAGP